MATRTGAKLQTLILYPRKMMMARPTIGTSQPPVVVIQPGSCSFAGQVKPDDSANSVRFSGFQQSTPCRIQLVNQTNGFGGTYPDRCLKLPKAMVTKGNIRRRPKSPLPQRFYQTKSATWNVSATHSASSAQKMRDKPL